MWLQQILRRNKLSATDDGGVYTTRTIKPGLGKLIDPTIREDDVHKKNRKKHRKHRGIIRDQQM